MVPTLLNRGESMLGLELEEVKVMPYTEEWKREFELEKQRLILLLNNDEIKIIHVGSTSIPGLSAKPIIDIAVGVMSKEQAYEVAKVLGDNNYEIKDSYEEKGEILASKKSGEKTTHFLHIEMVGSTYWNNFIYFKKYLLDHPEEVLVYENLKQELSKKFASDRRSYTKNKHDYISSVIEKSKQLYNITEC